MSFGRRLAPCPLLAARSGIDTASEKWNIGPGRPVNCDRPWNCAGGDGSAPCHLFTDMADDLTGGDPDGLAWVCFRCFADGDRYLGFYDSGPCSVCGMESILLNAVVR